MRASFIPVVLSISILAGVCLSQIFTTFHPNSLLSSGPLKPASKAIQRPLPTAFDRWVRSLDARYHAHISGHDRPAQLSEDSPLVLQRTKATLTSVAAKADSSLAVSPSNPLDTLHDKIKKLEMEDRTLADAIARADKVVKQNEQQRANAVAHPSSVSAKVSAPSFSPAQIAEDLKKAKESSKVASSALVNAQQSLKKLVKEEYNLRAEIDDLLSKLERVKIVTGAHVYVADGLGGSVFEAQVSRPIGGKSSVKIIKGVAASVDAVQEKVASDEAARDAHVAPSIVQKETGSDGMGGSNLASSVKEPQNARPAVVPPKGMTTSISGDDGMGEKAVPASKLPSNAEVSSTSDSLSSAKPDAGIGEIVVPAVGYTVPSNAEPKSVIMSHGKNADGIGGTGRRLTPRISNSEAVVSHGFKPGDGMGGRVHGAVFFGAVPMVPHTGPMAAIDKGNDDGMGGGKGSAP
jgi:hypothetical protein